MRFIIDFYRGQTGQFAPINNIFGAWKAAALEGAAAWIIYGYDYNWLEVKSFIYDQVQ